MSKLLLLDFPPEIISLVFKLLPNHLLNVLQSISQLRPYALQELYKSVNVHNSLKRAPLEISVLESFELDHEVFRCPISATLDKLIDIINEDLVWYIKQISFDDPRDLRAIHNLYPGVLSNAKITISFESIDMYTRGHAFTGFYQEIMNLPYDIMAIESFRYFNPLVYGDNSGWFNRLKSIVINESADVMKAITQSKFKSLTTLKFNQPIDIRFINCLPQSIQYLTCVVCRSEGHIPDKLTFPKLLISLQIRYVVVSGVDEEYMVDLTHLENLQLLKCDSAKYFILPRNLRSLKTFLPLNIEKVIEQCPILEVLNCLELDVPRNLCELPSGLKELKFNSRGLDYLAKLNLLHDGLATKKQKINEHANAVKFPKRLKKLIVEGNLHYYETLNYQIFSNSLEDCLMYLTELEIRWYFNCKSLGPLPRLLKKLSIVNCKGVNFHDLENLSNLHYLSIQGTHHDHFEFILSPTLYQMELKDNKFKSFKVTAESLHCLILKGNSFREFDNTVIQIPESTKELDLSYNEIELIDSSFIFPRQLTKFSLLNNKLEVIPELPPMLERFSCAMNHIGRREQIFDFPTCLQLLDLHCNELNGNTPFSGLNLLKCHYLRKLDLSNANIRGGYHLDQLPTVVELYSFPKSLTSLSIRGCNATSIVGTLPYFPQLEEVDLRDNEAVVEMFGEAVTEEYWLPDCCFPDTIKRIWITKNHFDSREFENLEKLLQLIPCFESLVATDQNINFGNLAQKLLNLSKDSEINMRGIEYWRTVTVTHRNCI